MADDLKAFQVKIPPHLYEELRKLEQECSRHFEGVVSNSDLVGALLVRLRQDRRGLLDDLAAYLDVLEAWQKSQIVL